MGKQRFEPSLSLVAPVYIVFDEFDRVTLCPNGSSMQLVECSNIIDHRVNPGGYYLLAELKGVLSERQQLEYWQCAAVFDKCFNMAKQNDLSESEKLYEQCMAIMKNLEPVLLDWLVAFFGQRLCYFLYKSNRYSEGIELTSRIIKVVELINLNGYKYMFFVGIQQKLNLARIYFQMNESSKAISLCSGCMKEMYRKPGSFETKRMCGAVSEQELLEITQYGMTVEVLSETSRRILQYFKGDSLEMERLVLQFIKPLASLNFSSLLPEPRYENIDRFISIMAGLCRFKDLLDEDILYFMDNKNADRKLINVLHGYIQLAEA